MRTRILALCWLALSVGGCKSKSAGGADEGAVAKAEDDAAPEQPRDPGAAEDALPREPCAYAMAVVERLDIYRGVDRPLDAARPDQILRRAQPGGELSALDWLAATDEKLGRVSQGKPNDVALVEDILAGLPDRDQDQLRSDLARIVTQLRAVALLEMRRLLAEVADGRVRGEAAETAWADARCLWDGGLQQLAARADALPGRGGEGWEAGIADAFEAGNEALAADPRAEPGAPVRAAKQQIEKGMYAVAYRLILADAEARTGPAAGEALGLVDALEDRLADRNGPGLARIRAQLTGAPAEIDPALIERELAVAFTKRARKYCDKAVSASELATPEAIAETWEGIIYTRVILPSMREALEPEGFDADSYLADWHGYLEAVEAGELEAGRAISVRLVEWNCAYQDRLGIAECTASANETQ